MGRQKFNNECEGCRKRKPLVVGAAFNGDGSFRMLCVPCTRREEWRNQRGLFGDKKRVARIEEPDFYELPEEVKPNPAQMGLFG